MENGFQGTSSCNSIRCVVMTPVKQRTRDLTQKVSTHPLSVLAAAVPGTVGVPKSGFSWIQARKTSFSLACGTGPMTRH
jgi:hypothetical protein